MKPGDSPGILTNLGNYNQSGGGFQVDIIGQGNVPRVNNGELVVDGSTTLGTGAEIIVNSEDGSFYIGGAYTIIDSVGSVTGTFSPTIITNTTIVPFAIYEPNAVLLDFRPAFLECAFDETGVNVALQLFTITNPNAEETILLDTITS